MKSLTRLSEGAGFSVDDERITVQREAWLPRETSPAHKLVFVRRGSFQLRVRQWEVVADPMVAYVSQPGDEQQIAHRVGVVDACTTVTLSKETYVRLGGDSGVRSGPISTSGRLDLAHRVLYARARADADRFEMTERVVRLAHEVLSQPTPLAGRSGTRGTLRSRRLAQSARELLAQDPVSLGLEDVARQLNSSPHHLSRVFNREIGVSLTRFRNVLRVRRVLDRIEEGEDSLSRLAADLGFSDHAHMSRMVRDQVGMSPSAVRRLFSSAASDQEAARLPAS